MARFYYQLLALLFWHCCAIASFAAPADLENYEILDAGFADIPPGSIVEGSVKVGGLQPDYVIDTSSPIMQEFLQGAADLGSKVAGSSVSERVEAITKFVSKQIKYKLYASRNYRAILREYRNSGRDIPLSEYLQTCSGICREHALLLHFALKAAGIQNFHVYAKVSQGGHTEDHAFVVFRSGSGYRIADAYNENFDGGLVRDLVGKGIVRDGLTIRIKLFNPFPRLYFPKGAAVTGVTSTNGSFGCNLLFHRFGFASGLR
jgi:hypothetical protein